MDSGLKARTPGTPAENWLPPPATLMLSESVVHVWRAKLDQAVAPLERLWQSLADDERTKAARFHLERDRRSYILAKGILRAILACYLDVRPGDVQFRYGPEGKPLLAGRFGASGARFNVAHSEMLALYAIARNREVGVDVEYVQSMPDALRIATRFFSAAEQATLIALPEDKRQRAFFNCWTRKEAYLKALGTGLSQPLDEFDVTLAPGEPAELLAHRGRPGETARWSLYSLYPREGYVAALAVEGRDLELQRWDFVKVG